MSAFVALAVLTVYLPEFCKSELSSPHFPLATKTVSADQLEPIYNEKWVSKVSALFWGACKLLQQEWRAWPISLPIITTNTYSLISFSLSKGLLGFLDVLLSSNTNRMCEWLMRIGNRRLPECQSNIHLQFVYLIGISKN